MKLYLILILSFFSYCKSSQQTRVYKQFVKNRYSDLKYVFNDNSNRYLTVFFVNDSILKLSNNTSIAHNYYLVNFTSQYSYKETAIGSIKIVKLLTSDKENYSKDKYIKPYDKSSYTLNSNAVEYIFPNIEGDIINFSGDFKKMQIREFSFKKVK